MPGQLVIAWFAAIISANFNLNPQGGNSVLELAVLFRALL